MWNYKSTRIYQYENTIKEQKSLIEVNTDALKGKNQQDISNTIKSKSTVKNENILENLNNYVTKLGIVKTEVAPKSNFYKCKVFNINSINNIITGLDPNTKYHAIKFEPKIDNPSVVHHIVIYGCGNKINHTNMNEESSDCSDICNLFIAAWEPGMSAIELPLDAGTIWGSADTPNVVYQIHYSNQGDTTITDSSYINVYFTEKLRKYDSGVMILGRDIDLKELKANKKNFPVELDCLSSCTSKLSGNIIIFGYLVHGHDMARRIYTTFSNPSEDSFTLGDNNYDFRKQSLIEVDLKQLKPGFISKTTCVYNTTHMGMEMHEHHSENEMCYNYIFYYPRENGLAKCLTEKYTSSCFINKKT